MSCSETLNRKSHMENLKEGKKKNSRDPEELKTEFRVMEEW